MKSLTSAGPPVGLPGATSMTLRHRERLRQCRKIDILQRVVGAVLNNDLVGPNRHRLVNQRCNCEIGLRTPMRLTGCRASVEACDGTDADLGQAVLVR